MQTFKEIFGRKEERQNLKNLGVCLLVVVALVVGSFGFASIQFVFEQTRQAQDRLAIETTDLAFPDRDE